MQNCAPESIKRPDLYAYGRALARTTGLWDYRVCHRLSYAERARSRAALSWTWQPKDCSISTVDSGAFSRWLGPRTLLFWGDSLTAQHFFSMVFMLGDDVISLQDKSRVTAHAESGGRGSGTCDYDGLGSEGGKYTEAVLRDGGRVLKVLGHAEMADELRRDFSRAWWRTVWEAADIIVFNPVGHHLRTVPGAFSEYRAFATEALANMAKYSKANARLILRTSNVGHLKCEARGRPLPNRAKAWRHLGGWSWHASKVKPEYYGAPREGTPDRYDWRAPALHEHIWGEQATANPTLARRFVTLNVSHVDMRADGHVGAVTQLKKGKAHPADCLHYCFPGPSDAWASALHQLLLHGAQN